VYRQRSEDFEKILKICYGSDLNTARGLIVPLISFIPMMGHDRVPDIIVSIATEKPDSMEGLSAIKALAYYKQDESVEALRKAAESSSWVTRVSIVESLDQISTAGACSLLGTMHQKDPSSPVREMALEAMEGCGPGV
ncbi:MAG: HEAT repeat domain-containing protein, partial [Pseudomonadota bacterium]